MYNNANAYSPVRLTAELHTLAVSGFPPPAKEKYHDFLHPPNKEKYPANGEKNPPNGKNKFPLGGFRLP